MGMPEVPKRENLPNIEEVVVQILESIAIEELAIAHIMNAEGEKMQAIVKELNAVTLSSDWVSEAFKNTTTTLNTLIMKEWMMLNKMENALTIYQKLIKEEQLTKKAPLSSEKITCAKYVCCKNIPSSCPKPKFPC